MKFRTRFVIGGVSSLMGIYTLSVRKRAHGRLFLISQEKLYHHLLKLLPVSIRTIERLRARPLLHLGAAPRYFLSKRGNDTLRSRWLHDTAMYSRTCYHHLAISQSATSSVFTSLATPSEQWRINTLDKL